MKTIHRSNMNGKALCGSDGNISVSGAFVTCEKCKEMMKEPTREERMKILTSMFILGSNVT
jgi:hypothetical protein